MADNNQTDSVAIAALFIAVVALFAAISQIAQAIFASARGLPNCDERVIGQWALKKWAYRNSRIRPRLQEFRLEVFFEAPIIFLAPANNIHRPGEGDSWIADGTEHSCRRYRINPNDIPKPNDKEPVHTVDSEKATWIWLLVAIKRMEKDSRRWEKECVEASKLETPPAPEEPSLTIQIQAKQRSFDMNPAMKKPFATTTISHLVELAAVLGLYWKVFNLEDNKYRAAGNGYSLIGSRIADFGIVFVFEKSSTPQFNSRRIIPTSEVKELCFGRLPTLYRRDSRKVEPEDVTWQSVLKTSSGDKNLKLEVLQLGSRNEIAKTLTQIGCNATTTFYYKNEKKHEHLFPVTFEIIGMLARTLHVRDRCFRFLPNPTIFPWDHDSLSLTRLLDAFRAYITRDYDTIKTVPRSRPIEAEVQPEIDKIGKLVNDAQSLYEEVADGDQLTYTKMNMIHDSIDRMDRILKEGESPSNQEIVLDILRRHLQEVLAAVNNDTHDRSDGPSFGDLLSVAPERRERRFMGIYFDRILWRVIPISTNPTDNDDEEEVSRAIHQDSDKIKSGLVNDPESVVDEKANKNRQKPRWKTALARHEETQRLKIWYTLVFRMICWLMLHDFDKNDVQVPDSDLMGNRQPVFIM